MTPFSRKFEKAYGKTLLRIAEGDLRTAKALIGQKGVRLENTVYLVQQSVEKSLKAVLCHLEISVPMTHDIGALLGALPDRIPLPAHSDALLGLTEYAMIRRYEEGFHKITDEEIRAVVNAGEGVTEWARQAIGN